MKKKSPNKCIAPGCVNDIQVKKHQICRTHANQMYRHGVISSEPLKKRNMKHVVKFV